MAYRIRNSLVRKKSEIKTAMEEATTVWVVALPRLPELPPRDERHTPVLLKFLSTTLLYRINNLVQKHIRGKPGRVRAAGGATKVVSMVPQPIEVTLVAAAAVRTRSLPSRSSPAEPLRRDPGVTLPTARAPAMPCRTTPRCAARGRR